MHIDTERLQNLNANMNVFAWLSKAVDYPDEQLVEGLLQDECMGYFPLKSAVKIKEYVNGFASPEELLLDMQKEYTRMCFVSKPRLVPLFESVYKEGKLFQDSTFQIARLYDEAGIKLGEEFRLPPDHITLELEFMSYLFYQEMEAIKDGNQDNEKMALQLQDETLGKHLAGFAVSFAHRLAQHARTPFYQEIGDILKEMFQFELQHDQN